MDLIRAHAKIVIWREQFLDPQVGVVGAHNHKRDCHFFAARAFFRSFLKGQDVLNVELQKTNSCCWLRRQLKLPSAHKINRFLKWRSKNFHQAAMPKDAYRFGPSYRVWMFGRLDHAAKFQKGVMKNQQKKIKLFSPWYHSHNQDVLPNLQPLKRMQRDWTLSFQRPRTPHTFCFHILISLPLRPSSYIHPLPQILCTTPSITIQTFPIKTILLNYISSLQWFIIKHSEGKQ